MRKPEKSYEPAMYLGAKKLTKKRAKKLRKRETKAEVALWKIVRNRRLLGFKFRRQHPIDIYIVDFYCHDLKLVIEADGSIHDCPWQKSWDKRRTALLNSNGIKVIRFQNSKILNYPEKVRTLIIFTIRELSGQNG